MAYRTGTVVVRILSVMVYFYAARADTSSETDKSAEISLSIFGPEFCPLVIFFAYRGFSVSIGDVFLV